MTSVVQSVLGPVAADKLGRTLTHEHLSLNYGDFYRAPPSVFKSEIERSLSLDNIGLIKQYPYASKENITFFGAEVDAAVLYDVNLFKLAGGGTIVENTTHGLKRQVKQMENISKNTGVNIIAGCGYYLDNTQSGSVRAMSEEDMFNSMVSEMTVGCADYPSVKCGVIGEVASDWPITDFEKRAIRATAQAQNYLRCPVTFHPGRNPEAPFEIMRLYLEAGGSVNRAIMSHLERTFVEKEQFLEFAKLGSFCQLDLFGTECSWYQLHTNFDMPSDAERIKIFSWFKGEGNIEQLLGSHDIHTRHRLVKFGGHGYAHLFANVVPKMIMRGFTQEEVDTITIENPRAWLTGERVK
ncbi:Phosphotriesterase-related protein [Frankliniella fusca]|uniref:Phosphotriesterase-related protein n=1 Tax=Frankliniella fusca TaxID=407009 RepID=A0AAE1LKM4_9NEOP|nr:Phosphotriesterase-related protein [Frankliniella fusca]